MPTGYTAIIEDKEDVTFREFALTCARAFGAYVRQRDEPADGNPPRELKPDPYYLQRVLAAADALRGFDALTEEQKRERWTTEHREAVRSRAEYQEQQEPRRARCEAMQEKVRAWKPPTPNHAGLRDFMLQQIEVSIPRDPTASLWPRPEQLPFSVWQARTRTRLVDDLAEAKESWRKEQERVTERNEWIAALFNSLDEVK